MLSFLNSSGVILIILSLFSIGAVGALILQKNNNLANWWGNGFAIIGSLVSGLFAANILASSQTLAYKISTSFPGLGLSFNIDRLSAFFILIISLITFVCSVYALGYVKHYYRKYNIGTLGFFYNTFIAGLLLVVMASNALFFLIAWEIMSLTSYFLVVYENINEQNVKAGTLYFIMTHVGTAFIILAFFLLYNTTGSLEFEAMKNGASALSPLLKNIIFVCALIGFGTKAGIIPLHIWLPSAHPAAPSHVSAIMSGVMIKTGIYMFIRMFFDILPNAPLWWGICILIVGSVSSLLGVLYALAEHDLKKLLAYHSIENIGIILLGLGSSLVFLSAGLKTFAMIGLIAALFHTLNHAIFKALLFLGAGSIISQTHTRNIEEYGGLIKLMPATALFFLVGSMAISALPPLNGFFSEWLTFQSLFSGATSFGTLTKLVFVLSAGALAFTGGLAAACFVKAFGVTFLARPRSDEAKHAKESDLSLQIGMGVLAALTLVIGVSAGNVSNMLSGVAGSVHGLAGSEIINIANSNTVHVNNEFAVLSMPALLAILLAALLITYILVKILSGKQKITVGRTWDCGTDLTPRMEITATGFSRSIITVFKNVLKPTRQNEIEYDDANLRYFPKSNSIHLELHDVYQSFFYKPLKNLLIKISDQMRKIQSGNMNAYILYIFIALMGLLLIVAK
ncbi:MAG: hydrogenase 4 subunit B [Patescibacteria group bacterium]